MNRQLPSLEIGGVSIAPALVLAPMSGVTDSAFRRMVLRASGEACGMVMSEFIKIELLTARQMNSVVRMSFHESERPVAIQIYGADAAKMAEAARMIEDAGADVVDINCGCPAPKVVRRGGGAGLLRNLPLLADILDATVAAVRIPVTIKIRNGWCGDSINAAETLKVAENHGARAIAVHGRTRKQLYRGEADWDIIARLKDESTIPVLGSGDVVDADGALGRFDATGCDGVMIGRGAVTNPWIFRQIADEAAGREPFVPTWSDTFDLLQAYLEMMGELYPPKVAPGRMKMMLSRLLKGFDADPTARITCLRMDEPAQMLSYLRTLSERLGVLHSRRADARVTRRRAAA